MNTFSVMVEGSFSCTDGPVAHQRMRFVDEAGEENAVAVSYWLDSEAYKRWEADWSLRHWWSSDTLLDGRYGYWRETITVPYDHHETIFSSPDYLIGLARTPGSAIQATTTNGYFGAANRSARQSN